MGVIGVDGGNTKTEVVLADVNGDVVSYVRGPGTNSHGRGGADGCIAMVATLVARTGLEGPADHGAFFLCGADVRADIDALRDAVEAQRLARGTTVDNDTFALLRTGTDAADAVAVVCGGGINCVGRNAEGRVARYPSLGWETGDWGGSEMLGREALFHAARAEDGRGEQTSLVDVICGYFGVDSVAAVGEAIHYGRMRETRLGNLASSVVEHAQAGDAVAGRLVTRMIEEIALMARRALRDLDLLERPANVVLGGGMLRDGSPLLRVEVFEALRELAPHARPVVPPEPPVVGATLAALDAVGASREAEERLRAAFRGGLEPEDVR